MGFEINEEALKRSDVFENVDLKVLKPYFSEIEAIRFASGKTLLSPGATNQSIYMLLEGELSICLQEHNSHAIATIRPGDCVGEISIIDDRPPSAYVRSSRDCKLLAIHRDTLTRLFELQPQLAVNLLKLLAERFRQNNEVLVNSFELQREYQDKAERDTLTGLHNRGWMNDVFPKQMELSERIGQKITMVMIDADHFKAVNDEHGHLVGDAALQHLARVIQENLRETDLLVRYGGEELVVLMPGTIISRAHVVAERVRALVGATPLKLSDGEQLKMTISLGMTEWREGESLESLIERVDQALYQAKQNGRNRIHILN